MKFAKMIVALALSAVAASVSAAEILGVPTQVHPSELYIGRVWFAVSGVGAPCNGWLSITSASQDVAKAEYATVLAAVLAGRKIFVSYDPATCQASYVSLTNM